MRTGCEMPWGYHARWSYLQYVEPVSYVMSFEIRYMKHLREWCNKSIRNADRSNSVYDFIYILYYFKRWLSFQKVATTRVGVRRSEVNEFTHRFRRKNPNLWDNCGISPDHWKARGDPKDWKKPQPKKQQTYKLVRVNCCCCCCCCGCCERSEFLFRNMSKFSASFFLRIGCYHLPGLHDELSLFLSELGEFRAAVPAVP